MKILITYASAGAGHFKAAQALYDYLKINYPAVEVRCVDILEKSNALFRFFYKWGYSFLIKEVRILWRCSYWITDFKLLRPLTRSIASIIDRKNTKSFACLLIEDDPDFIISTHFLTSGISASLKRAKRINSKLISVITDFGVHQFWISAGTDIYVVASGFTKEQLMLQGIKQNSIKEFGIPIETKFLKPFDKDHLYEKFGLEKNKFTVLMMTGSFGLGPLEEIVNALYHDVQVMVVCASNRELYARLRKRNLSGVKIFGLVDDAQDLMAVSDIIITKPGGLSIAEILAMELVPIFISAIPGQETINIKVLEEYGIGVTRRYINDIRDTVLDYRDHPEKLEKIKENIRVIKKPFATRDLCDAVCQGSFGPAG